MSIIQFTAPPLPHFILCGFSAAGPGRKHPERYALGEFDLLVVSKGCIFIGENQQNYEVSAGHALILRPDMHHYPTEGCREETISFHLHFHTKGHWHVIDEKAEVEREAVNKLKATSRNFKTETFQIQLPQFTKLLQPSKMYKQLEQLNALEPNSHQHWVRWQQQILFQEVLLLLGASMETRTPKPGSQVADQAASFLRLNYKEQVTTKALGGALNFHPVYIARCMQKQFGCSPMEYLTQYRLEQAKLLLIQTDLSISHISQEVGFQQASYFTSCFHKWEGLAPREFRKRFDSTNQRLRGREKKSNFL